MVGVVEIVIALVTVLFLTIVYFKWSYQYWERKRVPFIQPTIPWGTMGSMLRVKKSLMEGMKDNYDEFKSKGHTFGGLYMVTQPALLAVQPDLIKRVLSKDFQYFHSHGLHVDEEKNPLSGNLFMLDGEKWRNMRVKLTPTFTSGKMKMMFQTLFECGKPMLDYINNSVDKGQTLDIKDVAACFTTDVIGSCAFGIDCDSFKSPDAEFRRHGRRLLEPNLKTNLYQILNLIIPRINLNTTPKEVTDFFLHSFKSIVNYRQKNNMQRNDFVQLLLDINKKAAESDSNDTLTVTQMSVQAIMFFAAGFETSSTTMSFCLHELAHNQEIQQKLRTEINETLKKWDGKLTYDSIMEMKYLNMVLDETLRKYPPAAMINRVCTKDYIIEETGTEIRKGTPVFVSILGLHRDAEYFPEPSKFDPERFSDENKANIEPFTYLPFGEGPRICIGLRFGVMQAKVGLCLLLKNYIFTPHSSMRYDLPFDAKSRILSFEDTVLLDAKRIS